MLKLQVQELEATITQQQQQMETLTVPAERAGRANPESE